MRWRIGPEHQLLQHQVYVCKPQPQPFRARLAPSGTLFQESVCVAAVSAFCVRSYTGKGTVPSWGGEGIVAMPDFVAHFNRSAVRPKFVAFPQRKPTVCDKRLRTINTNAEHGTGTQTPALGSLSVSI